MKKLFFLLLPLIIQARLSGIDAEDISFKPNVNKFNSAYAEDLDEYVYIPSSIKDAIFEVKHCVTGWSEKYKDFYQAEAEHNAGFHSVITKMVEELLQELPTSHERHGQISNYYKDIISGKYILQPAPIESEELTEDQLRQTRFKRFKRYGSLVVNILEVQGNAQFEGNATFRNVAIVGDAQVGGTTKLRDVAINGNEIISGSLTVNGSLNVNGIPITGTPEVNNIGTGEGKLVASSTATSVDIKSLKAGSNIVITNNSTDVTINAVLSGGAVSSNSVPAQDMSLVRFDGTTGQVIQDSGVILTNANALSGISNLNASGTITAPTFVGNLSGNAASATTATTATTATNFTGSLAGEVTGTQGATVVSNAVSTNTANAIVRRDA